MNQQVLESKKQFVTAQQEKIAAQSGIIICGYAKLTVAQVSRFRVELRKLGAEYQVVKNTMIVRSLPEVEGIEAYLHGTSGVVYAGADFANVAKFVTKFAKEVNDALCVKCGVMDGKVLDAKDVVAISELPPREVLLARLLGSLNAPATNFVGVLAGVPRKFLYFLNALKDSKAS